MSSSTLTATEGRLRGGCGDAAYTRPVRRWVVVAWMLVGFLGQGYVFAARRPLPVAIERTFEGSGGALVAWWVEAHS